MAGPPLQNTHYSTTTSPTPRRFLTIPSEVVVYHRISFWFSFHPGFRQADIWKLFLEIVPYILHGLYIYTNSHEHPSVPCEEFPNALIPAPFAYLFLFCWGQCLWLWIWRAENPVAHFRGFFFFFPTLFVLLSWSYAWMRGQIAFFYIFFNCM